MGGLRAKRCCAIVADPHAAINLDKHTHTRVTTKHTWPQRTLNTDATSSLVKPIDGDGPETFRDLRLRAQQKQR